MTCQNRNRVMLVNIFFEDFFSGFEIRIECPFKIAFFKATHFSRSANDSSDAIKSYFEILYHNQG